MLVARVLYRNTRKDSRHETRDTQLYADNRGCRAAKTNFRSEDWSWEQIVGFELNGLRILFFWDLTLCFGQDFPLVSMNHWRCRLKYPSKRRETFNRQHSVTPKKNRNQDYFLLYPFIFIIHQLSYHLHYIIRYSLRYWETCTCKNTLYYMLQSEILRDLCL
jgi:hypothetical protein